mmetsp:Transcript_645/g.1580  ORF Transcript_645/g.1580 Transcript_645/m.1580 type:complete len:232 (-) Transcript_645:2204-2899(-)
MRNREETTRRPSGRPRRRQDGASGASRPIGMCRDQDQEAPRPWAAMCRRCLLLLPRRMKASAPCSPKLKKQLSQRSNPRRPWRGRRRRQLSCGPGRRLARNWSSGVESAATRSRPMRSHLELRYGVACGLCHENESSERPLERTKVVNHHLVQHRPSTSSPTPKIRCSGPGRSRERVVEVRRRRRMIWRRAWRCMLSRRTYLCIACYRHRSSSGGRRSWTRSRPRRRPRRH